MFATALRRRLSLPSAAVLLSVGLSPASTGCATIAHGGSQRIQVESQPPGAEVYLGPEMKGVTPLEVKVSRKSTTSVIRIEKPGYAPVSVPLRRGVSAAITWDFLFGGIQLANQGLDSRGQMVAAALIITLGTVAVDYLTGAVYGLTPGKVSVALEAKSAAKDEPRQ